MERGRWEQKWSVASASGNGDYTVSLAADGVTWGCSCPAWTKRRYTCRHILQKQLELSHEELKNKRAREPEPTISAPVFSKKRDNKYSDDGRLKRTLDLG